MSSLDTYLALRILSTIGHASALVASVFRLNHRVRIRKFWWDDFWALVSSILIAALLVMLWLQAEYFSSGTQQQLIIAAWITPLVFNLVVWTTRISICYSVTRILPMGTSRTITVVIIILLYLSCCGVFAGKVWLCGHDSSWHDLPVVICPQNQILTIVQIIVDVLSSVSLVVFPIYVLWNVDLPHVERRLILSLFASGIFITLLACVHSAYAFTASSSPLWAYTGHLEAAVSMIVSNLLVVGTRFYRFFNPERNDEASVPTPARLELTRQTAMLTEISAMHYCTSFTESQTTPHLGDSSYLACKTCTDTVNVRQQ